MDWAKLFSFSGRVPRQSYWVIAAVNLVVGFAANLMIQTEQSIWIALAMLVLVPLSVIGLATSIKRWHDVGKSGWWVLVGVIPVIGTLYALYVQGFRKGDDGPNHYGLPESGVAIQGVASSGR